MGNKTSPIAFRLGIFKKHDADWFAEKKKFPECFEKDMKARKYLKEKFNASATISKIVISRMKDQVEVAIKCLKPSVIVGAKGKEISATVQQLKKIFQVSEVRVKIFDIKKPEIDAACIAKDVANEIKKRGVSCRRIIKKVVQNAMRNGALGARAQCAGRLSGVEIARTEWYQEGAVPRQKLKANLDYAALDSYAQWGISGVKIWIYLGDFIEKNDVFGIEKLAIKPSTREFRQDERDSKSEHNYYRKDDKTNFKRNDKPNFDKANLKVKKTEGENNNVES